MALLVFVVFAPAVIFLNTKNLNFPRLRMTTVVARPRRVHGRAHAARARWNASMDWCALNDGAERGANADEAHAAAARTAEAEESRLAASYESALRAAASGDRATAIEALRHVLGHALTNDGENMSAGLARVKFLALKNLGRFLEEDAARSNATTKGDGSEALRCYAAAVELDDEDMMLWRRLGGAAAARGELSVARMAYERGIALRPTNQLLLEDLSEVCLAAGDLDAARGLAREILRHDSTHVRARAMADAPETLELSAAMRDAQAARAANAPHVDQDNEIAIRFSPSIEKSWGMLAGILARLGGISWPEAELEKTPGGGGDDEGDDGDDVTGVATPVKTIESAATPSQTPVPLPSAVDTPPNDVPGELTNLSFLRAVDGVDVPVGVPLGKSLRFIFDSESEAREPETVDMVDTADAATQTATLDTPTKQPEVIDLAADDTKDRNAETPVRASHSEAVEPSQGGDTATKSKRQRRASVEGPVRKSRRQEELDAKKAIEDEKERLIAEEKAAIKAAEAAERKRLLDEKKWAPEQQIAQTLLKLIGIEYEDPTLALAKAKKEKVGGDEGHAHDVKKKHLRELKEAAAKKAEEERRLKIIERVAAFVSTVDGSNGGVAHVAWRFLSTTAARWRPDTEDDCAPSPSMLFTIVQIYGIGPGDELAPKTRIMLCLADAAVVAARACSLEQPERQVLRCVAQGFLDQASTEMTNDITQDFQAESLFLRHKVAELSGEEPSVISFYLDQAQEVAPDDAEVPSPSGAIVDAAPARFTKQLLRAAIDSMKVKEVVTGAASRFSKGQTSELVSTLTPLLLADEDEELTDALTLTQSERQEALKVLAMAAREEGGACVVIELRALKCLYDLTKDSRNLRSMAEAIDSSKRVHTKHALEVVEQLGIQTIAASLFELHYSELAREPGVKKNLNKSRVASANMEAAALVLSSIQRASKGTVSEVIELHEKLHDRLADCRCCCGEARKGAFLKSSLIHLARHRNRVSAAREARQIAEEPKDGKKRVGRPKAAQAELKGNGNSTKNNTNADDDEEGGGRRRVRRQRVSSIETDDRTPQDRADRKILERLDKLIVQFCYCVYGFELERPKRRCREEAGATDAMLAITSEQNAADLWLSLQPYAMQSKDQQRETICAIMQAIRSHVSDPPPTKQGAAVDSYLTEFSDYLTVNLSVDEVVAKERALARALISRPTPDEALMELRLPGTPAKSDKSEALPKSPKASVVHVPGSSSSSASTVEDKITRYGEVYKTMYQFCIEVDGPALENALEAEQTDSQEIFALLESCMPSGVTPFERRNVATRAIEVVTDGLVAHASEDFMRMLKFDVQYNLKRPQSWIALADHMDTIKDIVLNDSAKIMTVDSFRASSMMELIKSYQVAIRRALLAADEALSMSYHEGHDETEWIRSQIHERLGQASYEFLQNAPPLYDGRLNTLNTNDASYKAALALCRSAYTRAAESNPDEWSYPYHLAKLAKKSGQPLAQVLAMHAGALALLPGSLEAIYQVANIRLRILMSIAVDGRKKMSPEDQALTIAVLKQPFAPGAMQNSWIGAYRDCIEALLFISKNYPKFHKANFRLAWARLKKSPGEIGHSRKALEYLEPLFTVPRTGTFKAVMVEIDDSNLGIDNSGRETQLNDGTSSIVYEAGVNEPRRRFIANVRRALQLYLALLYTNEDIGTLASAVAYLSDFKTSAKSRLSVVSSARDVRMYAVGLMLRAICQTLAQPELSDDLVTQRGERVPPHKRDTFLEHAYNTWFEFAIPARGNVSAWETNVSDAFEQITGEETRADSGPDLIKEPYQTAFFNASEVNSSTKALLDFEKFALEHVANLEAKSDLSALAAQFSLCTSRLTECKTNDTHVLEQGRARLRILQNANKLAFIRCSETTLVALAKGDIDLKADIDADTNDKGKSAEEEAEAETSRFEQEKAFADGETILITAQRMHRNTKQDSVTRANEYHVNRRNVFTMYVNASKSGRPLATGHYAEGTDLHRVYCELVQSMQQCETLGQKHRELVEAALANESQTTNPEQLKLIKGAYEDLNSANDNHTKITQMWDATCAAFRDETTATSAAMSKSDIATADTTAYILRVASAVSKTDVTDLASAESIVDGAVNDARKMRVQFKKATALREKAKKAKNKAIAAAEPTEPIEDAVAAAEDAPEILPDQQLITIDADADDDVQMLDA